MPPVIAAYPSTQQQLYAIGRAGWQSCSDRLAQFTALRAKYTALYITGKLAAIDAAEALPDDEQRKQVSVLLREQLSVKAEECRDFWQRLKLYIEEAYPVNEIPIQLNAAGQAHYTLIFTKPGYQTFQATNVQITLGQTTTLNVQLTPA